MKGICGTCGSVAEATAENEGYSYCCNDRIEYGIEASETIDRVIADDTENIAQLTKRIASLSSQRSVARRNGVDTTELDRKLADARYWKLSAKRDVKALSNLKKKGF